MKEEKNNNIPDMGLTAGSDGSIRYCQVIENSHFWTSIKILLHNIKSDPNFNLEYLKIGLENTLKHGYDIRKTNEK